MASAPGFSTGITDSVRINVQSVAKVDFTLTVGDVKQFIASKLAPTPG